MNPFPRHYWQVSKEEPKSENLPLARKQLQRAAGRALQQRSQLTGTPRKRKQQIKNPHMIEQVLQHRYT